MKFSSNQTLASAVFAIIIFILLAYGSILSRYIHTTGAETHTKVTETMQVADPFSCRMTKTPPPPKNTPPYKVAYSKSGEKTTILNEPVYHAIVPSLPDNSILEESLEYIRQTMNQDPDKYNTIPITSKLEAVAPWPFSVGGGLSSGTTTDTLGDSYMYIDEYREQYLQFSVYRVFITQYGRDYWVQEFYQGSHAKATDPYLLGSNDKKINDLVLSPPSMYTPHYFLRSKFVRYYPDGTKMLESIGSKGHTRKWYPNGQKVDGCEGDSENDECIWHENGQLKVEVAGKPSEAQNIFVLQCYDNGQKRATVFLPLRTSSPQKTMLWCPDGRQIDCDSSGKLTRDCQGFSVYRECKIDPKSSN